MIRAFSVERLSFSQRGQLESRRAASVFALPKHEREGSPALAALAARHLQQRRRKSSLKFALILKFKLVAGEEEAAGGALAAETTR